MFLCLLVLEESESRLPSESRLLFRQTYRHSVENLLGPSAEPTSPLPRTGPEVMRGARDMAAGSIKLGPGT